VVQPTGRDDRHHRWVGHPGSRVSTVAEQVGGAKCPISQSFIAATMRAISCPLSSM
jgi:hypothetical protein